MHAESIIQLVECAACHESVCASASDRADASLSFTCSAWLAVQLVPGISFIWQKRTTVGKSTIAALTL